MITVIDSTKFEIDFLDLYNTMISSFVKSLVENYSPSDVGITKQHIFDILFTTPSNMASTFYKTDVFVLTKIIDGVDVKGKEDIFGVEYTDITNIDEQCYFNF